MTDVILKQEADELLYDLLLEHRIIHDDVDSCFEQHSNEIKEMMSIFEHKTNKDSQLCLALLNLLVPEQGSEIMAYYSRKYNLSVKPVVSRDDVKLLLTACLKNRAFFSYALRVCKRIKIRCSTENIIRHGPVLGRNAAASAGVAIVWVFCPPKKRAIIEPTTYDTRGYAPFSFGGLDIDDINGIYCGHLDCLGNRRSKLFELTFQFFDKKTKQPVSNIPFYLDVELILNSDKNRTHTIKLDRPMNPSTICSKRENIDFTEGFRICKISEA